MPAKKLTTKAAIQKVLSDHGGPMKVKEIIEAALPLTALKGATPRQTIYSVVYSEARKPGAIFKQTGRGEFRLDKAAVDKVEKAAAKVPTSPEEPPAPR